MKRRAGRVRLPADFCCRGSGIATYLMNGGNRSKAAELGDLLNVRVGLDLRQGSERPRRMFWWRWGATSRSSRFISERGTAL
jgi:hypothetical protein